MLLKGFKKLNVQVLRIIFLVLVLDFTKAIFISVLVITGDNDKIVPSINAYRVAERIKNVVFHVVPNCGHLPHEEKPAEFLSAVRSFLSTNFVLAPSGLL